MPRETQSSRQPTDRKPRPHQRDTQRSARDDGPVPSHCTMFGRIPGARPENSTSSQVAVVESKVRATTACRELSRPSDGFRCRNPKRENVRRVGAGKDDCWHRAIADPELIASHHPSSRELDGVGGSADRCLWGYRASGRSRCPEPPAWTSTRTSASPGSGVGTSSTATPSTPVAAVSRTALILGLGLSGCTGSSWSMPPANPRGQVSMIPLRWEPSIRM